MNRKEVLDIVYGKRKKLMDAKKGIDQPHYNQHAIAVLDSKIKVLSEIIEELKQLE